MLAILRPTGPGGNEAVRCHGGEVGTAIRARQASGQQGVLTVVAEADLDLLSLVLLGRSRHPRERRPVGSRGLRVRDRGHRRSCGGGRALPQPRAADAHPARNHDSSPMTIANVP